ncbi:DUF1284 domain-containing protein [Methanobacterium formicicum]|uniref:DUF1284 domain-containing protein n=1 Tax=Methanobacterium formicicum (strain DSM 3637 / PP1) TaxID=1204725 RepID=K2QB82_METFP|nr:DUF1284 domain-containing protein [Methanobacterium formicicum]EKF85231.1 hypothetical protein A994_10128 [Methanobacterium formicicum DSM 3637]
MVKNQDDDGSEPLRIRAHHILCMQGFQGLGYSEEFTRNMTLITEKIQKNPSFFIKIIIEADSICEYCPNLSDGVCNLEMDSLKLISSMDSLVLKSLNLESGSVISSVQLKNLARSLSPKKVQKICGDCSWREDCLYFQEKCLN